MRESARKLFSSFFPLFEIWPSLWFLRFDWSTGFDICWVPQGGALFKIIFGHICLCHVRNSLQSWWKENLKVYCPVRDGKPDSHWEFVLISRPVVLTFLILHQNLYFFVTNEKMSVSGDRCSFEILDWTFGAGSLSPVGICWAIFFLLYNRGSWVVIVQSPVADKRGIFYRGRVVPKL